MPHADENTVGKTMDIFVLLCEMARRKASDLFITAGVAPSFKINGKVVPAAQGVLTTEQAKSIVYGVMTPEQRRQFEASQECNFAIHRQDAGRFRVNVFQQQNQVGMVVRRIETRIPTFEQLRLPTVIKDLTLTKHGLIIVTGATGSGKSTSLAAMIGYRNRHTRGHIVTIEDPVEFIHAHGGCIVTQREVGIDTQSFEAALKNALRQTPDVIMIGEIRSREVMEHAIAFAETGHLCLATLHASNANQVLDRIINFFPKDCRDQLLLDLSLNLKAVLAQRLIPMPGGRGRCPAVEVLVNTPLVADLILRSEYHLLKDVMKRSPQHGMKTFDQAVYELYSTGDINYEDALYHVDSANEFRLMVKLNAGENLSPRDFTLEKMEEPDS